MTDNDRPFLYNGGRYIDTITIRHNPPKGNILDGIPYMIDYGTGSIQMSGKDFDALAESIVRTLYDTNGLTMATAERLAYFANAVLADNEPSRCSNCGGSGQVGSPADPESCNRCRGTGVDSPDTPLVNEEQAVIREIRDILFPPGNEDASWSSDELPLVADVLYHYYGVATFPVTDGGEES